MSPCCVSRDTLNKSADEFFHLSEDGLLEAFHSESMNKLRNDLLTGTKHKNCEVCWQEEKCGQQSKRQRENLRFQEYTDRILKTSQELERPISLDLKLGNLCNLKCRICGPNNSSKWMEEAVRFGHPDQLTRPNKKLKNMPAEESRKIINNWPSYAEKFWTDLESCLPGIELLEIFGGEPMLNKRHFELLKKSVADGWSKKQNIHYNTNGTTLPPEEILKDVFPQFKQVNIMLSVDGTGRRFEYQRYPAKFDALLENFEKYRSYGFEPQICITVSVLTVYHIFEDLEFWKSKNAFVYLNMLYEPYEFDIRYMSESAKAAVETKKSLYEDFSKYPRLLNNYQAVFNHMHSQAEVVKTAEMFAVLQKIDEYRKQDFKTVFSDWADKF